MLRFAAVGLLSTLSSISLATSLRQSAAPSAANRKCNVQDSKGARFLVDNSKLQATTRGLSFRRAKDNQARDPQTVAMWGSEVTGIDEGDGWVKVGDCFLPMFLKDTPILLFVDADVPEAKAALSQLQGAKTRPMAATLVQEKGEKATEAQLRAALAEAAEVTQAVVEHLKAEKAKNKELQAKLAEQQSNGDGGKRLAQLEPQSKTGAEHSGCAAEVENKRKEFEEEIAELKEQAEVLTQTNTDLENKLQQKESEKANAEKRLQFAEDMNRELSKRLEKVSLAAKFGAAQNSAAATGIAEEEVAKMNKQREQLQATMDEMIASAQQTSIENAEVLNHLYQKIKGLKKQLQEAHVREEALRAAANATANATAKATANATDNATANVATQRLDVLGAMEGKVDANTAVVSTASSAEILEMQARLESSERKNKELAAQVKKVQTQSDQFLVMAGTQIKDIQAKMAKNNHTFQLRFEACERRNAVLAAGCNSEKKGSEEATSNVSGLVASEEVAGEAEPLVNASAQLLRGHARTGVESKSAAQATARADVQSARADVQSRSSSTGLLPPLAFVLLLVSPAVC